VNNRIKCIDAQSPYRIQQALRASAEEPRSLESLALSILAPPETNPIQPYKTRTVQFNSANYVQLRQISSTSAQTVTVKITDHCFSESLPAEKFLSTSKQLIDLQ